MAKTPPADETQNQNPDPAPPATQDPTQEDQGASETAPDTDGGTEPQADLVAASNEAGYHGAIPSQADDVDDALKAKTVEDAAADQDVAATEDSYFGVLPDTDKATVPVPMADQKAPPKHLRQTEDVRQGYVGTLPDADNRPDLTLAAAAKDAQEQYGDGKPE